MLSMPRIVRPDPFQELGPPLTRSSRIIKRNKELLEIWDRQGLTSNRTKPDAILHCRSALL